MTLTFGPRFLLCHKTLTFTNILFYSTGCINSSLLSAHCLQVLLLFMQVLECPVFYLVGKGSSFIQQMLVHWMSVPSWGQGRGSNKEMPRCESLGEICVGEKFKSDSKAVNYVLQCQFLIARIIIKRICWCMLSWFSFNFLLLVHYC